MKTVIDNITIIPLSIEIVSVPMFKYTYLTVIVLENGLNYDFAIV